MIVHELDDETEDPKEPSDASVRAAASAESPQEPHGPSTRRKAQETQYRLGVGRPTAIGGSGARAITTFVSKSKGKRTKALASVRPVEDVIREEEEGNVYLYRFHVCYIELCRVRTCRSVRTD